jgi:hypothetical protein
MFSYSPALIAGAFVPSTVPLACEGVHYPNNKRCSAHFPPFVCMIADGAKVAKKSFVFSSLAS